ncbi:MAG: hypothetical protein J1E83_06040 [Lachnospiraceae bacterium]|nr:hypothetical protein [Lachnospiraceae bacterium]
MSSYKQIYRKGYSNNYLSTDKIERYISLQRIYFEKNETSLLFFTDEEKYYRLHAMLGPDMDMICKQDKPLMLRNVYREGMKTDALLKVEGALKQQGFLLYDETVQILAQPLEKREEIQRKYNKASSFLNRFGIKIGYARKKDMEQIINLRNNEPLLKDYHFLYETEEEILNDIEKGYYRCAFNQLEEVCAAQHYSISNNTLQGDWLAVKDEYKVRYGLGIAMAYHSFLYTIEQGISNYYGWVARDNIKSIKYHQAIGYELTDKWADEWLLV